MEAPVIYLEPPLILPKSQIKIDEEVENFLKKVGLEDETNDKSDDPYKITNIDDAKTTESSIKSRLSKMRKTREDMFKRMRTLSIKIPGDPEASREFNKLKNGLKKLDDALENQIKKLTQVEHVKAALIDKKGAGSDAMAGEEQMEEREEEIENEEEKEEEENGGEEEEPENEDDF
ncbi:hypothetical protein MACJ_002215 [Theileria orientalis]|uniref:Uncharacterized protein n=1 Tax=Theileria orientalis TaxID=68886 RepID=A0A976M5U8_THEOR|nr:hypothetical protein MACJ_002215 [Theileria orientalis]